MPSEDPSLSGTSRVCHGKLKLGNDLAYTGGLNTSFFGYGYGLAFGFPSLPSSLGLVLLNGHLKIPLFSSAISSLFSALQKLLSIAGNLKMPLGFACPIGD